MHQHYGCPQRAGICIADASLKKMVAHRLHHPQETLLDTAQTEHGSAMVVCLISLQNHF